MSHFNSDENNACWWKKAKMVFMVSLRKQNISGSIFVALCLKMFDAYENCEYPVRILLISGLENVSKSLSALQWNYGSAISNQLHCMQCFFSCLRSSENLEQVFAARNSSAIKIEKKQKIPKAQLRGVFSAYFISNLSMLTWYKDMHAFKFTILSMFVA